MKDVDTKELDEKIEREIVFELDSSEDEEIIFEFDQEFLRNQQKQQSTANRSTAHVVSGDIVKAEKIGG